MSGTSAERADAQASVEDGKRIQNFEEAFARIRSATGIEDIEELVRSDWIIGRTKIERVKKTGTFLILPLLFLLVLPLECSQARRFRFFVPGTCMKRHMIRPCPEVLQYYVRRTSMHPHVL